MVNVDEFQKWFAPENGTPKLAIWTDRYQIYAYELPDNGELLRRLSEAEPEQVDESIWLRSRLKEATEAREKLIEPAILLLLRESVVGCVTDDEVKASMSTIPKWLLEDL